MRYLHGVLGPIIDRVFEEKKYVELDPSKVGVQGCRVRPGVTLRGGWETDRGRVRP